MSAVGAAAETGATPRMSVRGIKKTFGSIQALRGVDLDLWPGECLGLVGDNAAGKSTLTKILAGTYIPDQGVIALDQRFRPQLVQIVNEIVGEAVIVIDHQDHVAGLSLMRF